MPNASDNCAVNKKMIAKFRLGGQALVLGSGIAGLVSARVLSDYFDEVHVFERDESPRCPESRKGVPQASHYHGLLKGGLDILTELFPRLGNDLTALGAVRSDGRLRFHMPEGISYSPTTYEPDPPADEDDYHFFLQSRDLLEFCIRRRVEALDNVQLHYSTSVTEPYIIDDRIGGIILGLEDGIEELVEAELVIDATGRSPRTMQWIKELGIDPPREAVVNCSLAYTSMFVRPKDPLLLEGAGYMILPTGYKISKPRTAGVFAIENGLWHVTASGRFGDFPPKDMDGFLEYIRSLANTHMNDLISTAQPLSEPTHFRVPYSRRRKFEEMRRFPNGLLPIGDAICNYNPLYGQGISAACSQAKALDKVLRQRYESARGLDRVWQDFFPLSYEAIRAPWLFAATNDLQNPNCTGDFPAEEAENIAKLAFISNLAANKDRSASLLLRDIRNLRVPLSALSEAPWAERFAKEMA